MAGALEVELAALYKTLEEYAHIIMFAGIW